MFITKPEIKNPFIKNPLDIPFYTKQEEQKYREAYFENQIRFNIWHKRAAFHAEVERAILFGEPIKDNYFETKGLVNFMRNNWEDSTPERG